MKKFFILFILLFFIVIFGALVANKISDDATSVKSVDSSIK